MNAVFYAVLAMFSLGINNCYIKIPSEKIGGLKALFYRNFVLVSVLLLMFPFFGDASKFNLKDLSVAIAIALSGFISVLAFFKALGMGKIGIITPITNLNLVISTLVGVFLFKDRINLVGIASIIVIVISISMLSFKYKEWKQEKLFRLESGVPYALLVALIWGISVPLFSIPSEKLGAFNFSLVLESTNLIVSALIIARTKNMIVFHKKDMKLKGVLILAGILGVIGSLSMNAALGTGQIIISMVIITSSPLVATIYSALFFGERLEKEKYLWILLAIISTIVLVYSKSFP